MLQRVLPVIAGMVWGTLFGVYCADVLPAHVYWTMWLWGLVTTIVTTVVAVEVCETIFKR